MVDRVFGRLKLCLCHGMEEYILAARTLFSVQAQSEPGVSCLPVIFHARLKATIVRWSRWQDADLTEWREVKRCIVDDKSRTTADKRCLPRFDRFDPEQVYRFLRRDPDKGLDTVNIVVGMADRYGVIAAVYAKARRRAFRLAASMDELCRLAAGNYQSVAVFAEPELLDDDRVNKLYSQFFASAAKDPSLGTPALGIFTGRDVAAVSWLAAKNMAQTAGDRCTDERTILVGTRQPEYLRLADLGHTNTAFASEDDSVIQALESSDWLAVSACAHGDLLCATLADTLLCSREEFHTNRYAVEARDGLPRCYNGSCYITATVPALTRFPVALLRARILVLNSCGGFVFSTLRYSPGVGLALAAIDGMQSHFIGSQTVKIAALEENIFFMALLKDGRSVGKALVTTWSLFSALRGDVIGLGLVGDPSTRFFPVRTPKAQVIEVGDDSSGRVRFRARLAAGKIHKFVLRPGSHSSTGILRGCLTSEVAHTAGRGAVIGGTIGPSRKGELTALSYLCDREKREATFGWSETKDNDHMRQYTMTLQKGIAELVNHNLNLSPFAADLDELKGLVHLLMKSLHMARIVMGRNAVLAKLMTMTEKSVRRVQKRLCERMLDKCRLRNSLQVTQADRYTTDAFAAGCGSRCSGCGRELSYIRKLPLEPGLSSRISEVCPRCGLIGDRPVDGCRLHLTCDAGEAERGIAVGAQLVWPRGACSATVGAAIINAGRAFEYAVRPGSPGHEAPQKIDLVLRKTEVPLHEGPATAVVVAISDLHIAYGFQPVRVAE